MSNEDKTILENDKDLSIRIENLQKEVDKLRAKVGVEKIERKFQESRCLTDSILN